MHSKDSGGIPDDFLPSLLNALSELSDPDAEPDRPISQDTREALGKFIELAEEENKRFLSGNFAIDPAVLKKVHRAAVLLKRLEKNDALRVVEIHTEPGIGPASIEFETGGLILSDDDLSAFADVLESCDGYEMLTDTEGKCHVSMQFRRLWTEIGEVRNES